MAEVQYVKRVKSLRPRLVEEMKPEEIASKLCNMKCLNRREKESLLDVQRRKGRQSHNAKLLDILLRKDPNLFVWEKFVGVLEDTGNGTLAHLLRHEISEDAVLSELDKCHLRNHHYEFVSGMETSGVLRILYEEQRYFRFSEKQDLQSMRTSNDQADYLMMSVIQLGTYRHLSLLKKALQRTGQDTLASYLPIGEGKGQNSNKTTILAGQKVPQTSTSEHRGRTAKQIAESKKARKPLDEFNVYHELEGSLSSLMKACRIGDNSKVKVLMAKQTMETYHTDYNSANALYWAVVQGDLELIRFMEGQGLNVKMLTKKKETLLHLACTLGHDHLVESLVKIYNIEPFAVDTSHKTALDRVAENGDIRTLMAFVNCEVQPTANSAALAAFAGRTAFIEHLFTNLNFPVDSTDMYSRTALHRACESGKPTTVRLLMMKDADVTLVTAMGRNILHILAESGNMEILNLLLPILKAKSILSEMIDTQDRYNGVDLCFLIPRRDKGRDAWHYVEVERNQVPIFLKKTKCGNVDVAQFGTVIKSGWGVNPNQDAVDDIEDTFKYRRLDKSALKDQTPLHIAVVKNNVDVAKLLLETGADPHVKDKFGHTALYYACSWGSTELVAMLEGNVANISNFFTNPLKRQNHDNCHEERPRQLADSLRDASSDINQLLVKLGCGPVVLETGRDSVFAVTTQESAVGQNAQQITEENQDDEAVNLLARRTCDLMENFRAGPLERLHHHISHGVLLQIQRNEGDLIKQYLADSLRDFMSEINQVLMELGSGPVVQETAGDYVLALLTYRSAINHSGQNAQQVAEENQQDEAIDLLARRNCDLVENFRAGPLEQLNHHIGHEVLLQKQRDEGNSVEQYLIDILRDFTAEINQLLEKLGSGPIIQETGG